MGRLDLGNDLKRATHRIPPCVAQRSPTEQFRLILNDPITTKSRLIHVKGLAIEFDPEALINKGEICSANKLSVRRSDDALRNRCKVPEAPHPSQQALQLALAPHSHHMAYRTRHVRRRD